MWRERLGDLFSFPFRRKVKPELPDDRSAVSPSLPLRREGGATITVRTIPGVQPRRIRAGLADIFDYALGFLIIGLLSLGGSFWTTRHRTPSDSSLLSRFSGSSTARDSGQSTSSIRPGSLPGSSDSRSPRRVASSETEGEAKPETPPAVKRVVAAVYTQEALNAGFHGRMFVTVFVNASGVPEKMEPTSPVPFGLERPIREAVFQWRFEPATAHGVPVPGKTVIEVPFTR